MQLEEDWEQKEYCQRCRSQSRNLWLPFCNPCYELECKESAERLKQFHWHLWPGQSPPFRTAFEKACLFKSECEECNRAIGLTD